MGKVLAKLFGKKDMRILMLGLDAAGKTSILVTIKIQNISFPATKSFHSDHYFVSTGVIFCLDDFHLFNKEVCSTSFGCVVMDLALQILLMVSVCSHLKGLQSNWLS